MYKNFYKKLTTEADKIQSNLTPEKAVVKAMDSSEGLMKRTKEILAEPVEGLDDPTQIVSKYLNLVKSTVPKKEEVLPTLEESPRPKPKGYMKESEVLLKDPEFMKNLEKLKEKYPQLTDYEIFSTIKGESSFDPKAVSQAGAVGLFQIMPEPLSEIGFTSEEILSMEPAEQLLVYEQYLDRWDYDGEAPLAIMQAAPAFRNASDDTVVYKKGSKAWKQNSVWRPEDGGDITVGSVKKYYRKF